MEVTNTIGRRKTAIARVYMTPGKGNIVINDRELKDYFTTEVLQYVATQPLTLLGVRENYDVKVNMDGGG